VCLPARVASLPVREVPCRAIAYPAGVGHTVRSPASRSACLVNKCAPCPSGHFGGWTADFRVDCHVPSLVT
jgi:hypothetical protein